MRSAALVIQACNANECRSSTTLSVEQVDGLWPWSKNHPWSSWRERYKKNEARFDYEINKILKKKRARGDGGTAEMATTSSKVDSNTTEKRNIDTLSTSNPLRKEQTAVPIPAESSSVATVSQTETHSKHIVDDALNHPSQLYKARKTVNKRDQRLVIDLCDEDENEVTSHIQKDKIVNEQDEKNEEEVTVENRTYEDSYGEEKEKINVDSMDMDSRLHRFRQDPSDAEAKAEDLKRKDPSDEPEEGFGATLDEITDHLRQVRKKRKLMTEIQGSPKKPIPVTDENVGVDEPRTTTDVEFRIDVVPHQSAGEGIQATFKSATRTKDADSAHIDDTQTDKDGLARAFKEALVVTDHVDGEIRPQAVQMEDLAAQTVCLTKTWPVILIIY